MKNSPILLLASLLALSILIVGIVSNATINRELPTLVASGADYYDRPRINNNGEIVWAQGAGGNNYIWSNLRGQISSGGQDRNPDINDSGEIIWRFGDGGQGPDGIMSNIRGLVYPESGGTIDPYYNTHRINNNGEIVWSRPVYLGPGLGWAEEIWSNTRGRLTYSSRWTVNRELAINDLGEVVYVSYNAQTTGYDIISTEQGFITNDTLWEWYPDINNQGEIVWYQTNPFHRFDEIWSNTRGIISADGEFPSINNLGEIVWQNGMVMIMKYTLALEGESLITI